MEVQRGIVVFDVARGTFDIYKDVPDAAGHINMPIDTLRYTLERGIRYYNGYFIGYGDIHKSNRGRR